VYRLKNPESKKWEAKPRFLPFSTSLLAVRDLSVSFRYSVFFVLKGDYDRLAGGLLFPCLGLLLLWFWHRRMTKPKTLKKQATKHHQHPEQETDSSDDEPPIIETIQDRLLWRRDPDESKSDWTIEIVVKKHNNKAPEDGNDDNAAVEDDSAAAAVGVVAVHTYHVHVRDLTVGPRRSEYFVQMLRDGGGRFAESQTRTSRIELHEIAAAAFPVLLDFCYSTGASSVAADSIPFTTNNATALYSMAKYFGIRSLRSLAKQFWKTDIRSSKTCETYYEHATMLHEEKILETATTMCTSNIMQLKTSSPLLRVAYVKFCWMSKKNYGG
jgi:BTB/POZ domain